MSRLCSYCLLGLLLALNCRGDATRMQWVNASGISLPIYAGDDGKAIGRVSVDAIDLEARKIGFLSFRLGPQVLVLRGVDIHLEEIERLGPDDVRETFVTLGQLFSHQKAARLESVTVALSREGRIYRATADQLLLNESGVLVLKGNPSLTIDGEAQPVTAPLRLSLSTPEVYLPNPS